MEFERVIPADHPSLAGHFPGAPIVPGVVLLEEVMRALGEIESRPVAEVSVAKFLRPLLPAQRFTVAFQRREESVQFFCRVEDRPLAQGRLQLALTPTL